MDGRLAFSWASESQMIKSSPANALSGGRLRVTSIWSLAMQLSLVTVHWKMVVPASIPLMVALGESVSDKTAFPETTVQTPVPTEGKAAERVAVSAHVARSGPAFGVIGFFETLTVNVSLFAGQSPFVMVHTN